MFGVIAVQNPLAAREWLAVLCLLVTGVAVFLTSFWSVTAWGRVSAYRSEKQGFPRFARHLGSAERGLFLSGQWIAIAVFLLLATFFAMAFPGQAILAALLTPVAALTFAALRWSGPVRGAADAGILAYVSPSQLSGRGGFAIGWSLHARLAAARRVAVSRTGDAAKAQDFLAAIDSGGAIRAAPPGRLFRPMSVANLRLTAAVPALRVALPFMLLAWLVAAVLPSGLLPKVPAPGDIFSFLESEKTEPETDQDEQQESGQEEGNSSRTGPQDQGNEAENGGGNSGSGDEQGSDSDDPGDGGTRGTPGDGSKGDGSSGGEGGTDLSQDADGGDSDSDGVSPQSSGSQSDEGSGDAEGNKGDGQESGQDGAEGSQSGEGAGVGSNATADQEDAGIVPQDADGDGSDRASPKKPGPDAGPDGSQGEVVGGQEGGQPSQGTDHPKQVGNGIGDAKQRPETGVLAGESSGQSGLLNGAPGQDPGQGNSAQQALERGGSDNRSRQSGNGRNAESDGAEVSSGTAQKTETDGQDGGSAPGDAQAGGTRSGDATVNLELSQTGEQTGAEVELDISIGVTEDQAETGPEIAVFAGDGNESETDIRVSVEGGETTGTEISAQMPQPLFAGPGQAPALVEGDLPARNSPAPSLPVRPPHQRVPAWIADLYRQKK